MFTNEECVICLDMLDERECCRLECGHHIHTDCLEKYADYNTSDLRCPTCQHPITISQETPQVHHIVSTVCCVVISIIIMTNMIILVTTFWI